jgi:hypothetical protein
MKKVKSLYVLILLTFIVASCGDDEQKVSPAKTKAAFENLNSQLATDLADLQAAPGFTAMNSLADLTSASSPFGRLKSVKPKDVRGYLKTSVTSLRSMITNASSGNARVSSDEPFNFNAKKGTYTWSAANQGWSVALGGSIIKIIFPTAGAESTNNNAEFQLTAYSEVSFTDEWGTEYNPTVIQATLKVDGTKKAEIDLEAEYSQTTWEPIFIDLYLFFDPFSIELNLNDKKSTSSSVSAKLSKNDKTLIAFGVTVNYVNSSKEEPNKVSGYVQLLNVRFVADIDENGQSIVVKVNGDTAGKIIIVEEEDPNYPGYYIEVPYVKYNDGTQEKLSDLLADLEAQLGGLGI